MLQTIHLAVHDLLDVLMCEELKHQWDVVGVQKKLCKVLRFENI